LFATPGVGTRKRVVLLFGIVSLVLVSLTVRLAYIQFIWGEELRKKALETRMRDIPVAAKRGTIFDRKGRELAVSVSVESVYAFPAQIKNPEDTAKTLSSILGMKYDDVHSRLTRNSSFQWIKRKIDPEQAKKIRAARLSGIGLTQESKRFYPKGSLAAHVLGISGIDNQGLEGIEVAYDGDLRGVPGRIIIETDARGKELPQALHSYVPPVEGNSLILTLDEVVQFIAERELERAMVKTQARAGNVLVLDPKSGEILAMAARPTFDPNRYDEYPDSNRRNSVISDTFPPGSTFKPVTAAAALEEGVTSVNDRYYCGGSIKVPGHTISCWVSEGHGSQNFIEVIQNSCNVGFVNMGLRLGPQRFFSYLEAFGFTSVTGIDLPGEATGIMMRPEEMKPVDLAVMSFGQTLTVTPIQLACAIAAIANDGLLIKPHLVKEVRGPDGGIVHAFQPVVARRAISPKTAQELRYALEQVVEKGTGRQARVEGYRIAGKTGTAQKVIGGRIVEGKYISSFVGFGPANDPRVVALITIDEPVGEYYGGVIAAPVFGAMIADILRYLEVPPEPKDKRTFSPSGASTGGGGAQSQGGGRAQPAGGAAGDGAVVVPDVLGMTIREADGTLKGAGLKMEITGSGFARSQDPPAGTYAPRGSSVRVRFAP